MTIKHRLTFAFIKAAAPGKYNDGSGLWLHKRRDGGAQWFLRVTVHGGRKEMGLGGYPDVSLKDARKLAERWRSEALIGNDPIKARHRERRELSKADNTLSKIAHAAFEARKAELKGDGKAGRWFTPLELHVLPKIGSIPIEEIDQTDVKDALAPIWHSKADTARKAMNRLNLVFKYAVAMGLNVDLMATTKAKELLGKTRHVTTHIPALHWNDVPAFYASLAEPSLVHLAMRLLILTGVRSAPLRFMRFDEIRDNIWTVPAENMKGRKGAVGDFRVPLSAEALRVIELAAPFERDSFLFPNVRKGVMSDATMARMMERRGMQERPHGFRSSLRTWLAECTDAPHEVCETVLAHVNGTSVQRSYRRTDYLEQRAALMERWGQFVTGPNFVEEKLENNLISPVAPFTDTATETLLTNLGLVKGSSDRAKQLVLQGLLNESEKKIQSLSSKPGAPKKPITIDMERAASLLGIVEGFISRSQVKRITTQREWINVCLQVEQILLDEKAISKRKFGATLERLEQSVGKGLRELGYDLTDFQNNQLQLFESEKAK